MPFVVAGVGVSMAIPAAQTSVIGSVSADEIGKAAGVNSTLRELGGVFGIALAVAVFAASGSYASAAGVQRRLRAGGRRRGAGSRSPARSRPWRCRAAAVAREVVTTGEIAASVE